MLVLQGKNKVQVKDLVRTGSCSRTVSTIEQHEHISFNLMPVTT